MKLIVESPAVQQPLPDDPPKTHTSMFGQLFNFEETYAIAGGSAEKVGPTLIIYSNCEIASDQHASLERGTKYACVAFDITEGRLYFMQHKDVLRAKLDDICMHAFDVQVSITESDAALAANATKVECDTN